jgi:threonine dehydrogenase-like Zn-dependent dehydrogenase
MRALVYIGPKQLEWRDLNEPKLAGDGEAIVRHLAVATCDLDAIIVSGESPFPPPFQLGHEGVAEVLEIGDRVQSVRPGDRVLVPFQINCGTCTACRQGRTGNCETLSLGQTYGFGFGEEGTQWGGFLSDKVRVPFADAMLVPIPEGLASDVAASASDNITDAYRTVAPHLGSRPGAPVLICGGAGPGSIGLLAVAHALALGAEEVLYVDEDSDRRKIAEGYGAKTLDRVPDQLERSYPITVDASSSREGLALALASLDRDGVCTSTGIYFDQEMVPPFPLLGLYVLGATFHTGRIHARRDAPAVLDLLACGAVDVEPVITTAAFDDAADALLERFTKLVFVR